MKLTCTISQLTVVVNILCDIIKDPIAGFLVQQPLANENTGRRGVEFATAQHTVAVSHAILERSIVNFTAGISAHRWRMVLLFNPLSVS